MLSDKMNEKQLSDLTVVELKSLAYDQISQLQMFQNNLNIINQELARRNQQQQQKSNEVVTKQSDKQKEQNPFYRYLNKGNQSMLQMLLMKYLKLR